MNNVRNQIREFIIHNFLFGEAGDLSDQASFLERGVIDSTGVLELVAYLENTFAIKVRDDELTPDNLDSIDAVAAYLERKCTASGHRESHEGTER